jgi:hypothetical protein
MSDEELDALEQREADQTEVQRRRLREEMDEEAKGQAFAQLLRNEGVRDLLWQIMGWCGIFTDPMNANFGNVAYGLGKAAIGKKLLAEINLADPQAWLEMQLKAGRAAQDEMRERSLKKLRKPANP